jgi:para-aminobenzoate synthetase component 1
LLSVGIRIFWSENDGKIHFGTGAGITWQSDPNQEWEETQLKAKRLTAIASGVLV